MTVAIYFVSIEVYGISQEYVEMGVSCVIMQQRFFFIHIDTISLFHYHLGEGLCTESWKIIEEGALVSNKLQGNAQKKWKLLDCLFHKQE